MMNMPIKNRPTEAENEELYERFDSTYAVVTGNCSKGAFLILDGGGEQAFAYKFASLRPGTKVLCSIQKLAEGNRSMRVSIDAVLYYPPLTAVS